MVKLPMGVDVFIKVKKLLNRTRQLNRWIALGTNRSVWENRISIGRCQHRINQKTNPTERNDAGRTSNLLKLHGISSLCAFV